MSETTWMHEEPTTPPTVLQHWNGLATITLSKLGDGSARLLWIFDEDYPDQLGMFVHLTSDEAQVVFETDPLVGLLERVRPTLSDTTILIWHVDQQVMSATAVELPRTGSESDLWDYLDGLIDRGFDRSLSMRDPEMSTASDDVALIALLARERTLASVP